MPVKNRTIFTRDNIEVLRGMDSASVDLIYLDPPFNSNRHYSAPVGSEAAGASFKDAWTFEDTDAAWWGEISEAHPALYKVIAAGGAAGGKGDQSYLIYMAARLLEMHRVLKESGSIYLHCDPTMSHGLKLVMDAIFGKKNFQNEIIWRYHTGGASKRRFSRKHDVLLFYGAGPHYRFNAQTEDYREDKTDHFTRTDKQGRKYRIRRAAGKDYRYYKDHGRVCHDVWEIDSINAQAKERIGYPTQKPLALLRRIVAASSDKGGTVFDPFCGCATTLIAAEMLGRNWIGIDISRRAAELIKIRAEREIGGLFPIIHRTDIPRRADAPKRSRNIRHVLFGRQEGLCKGCKTNFPFRNFTVDHEVPLSKGGADTDDNLQLLCGFCNSVKGGRSMAYLRAQLKLRKILP